MPETSSAGPAEPLPPDMPLSDVAARGVLWTLAQAAGSKVIGALAQIVLAWLLVPEAFGQVILAYSFAGFASLLQKHNLGNVLIQRRREYDLLANPAFWISLTAAGISMGVMVAGAPVAGWLYDSATVAWLVVVLATSQPLNAAVAIYQAQLQIALRFRTLAMLEIGATLLNSGAAVLLAWQGLGPFALIVPVPLVAAARLALLAALVRPPLAWRLDLPLWRDLLADAGRMIAQTFFYTITAVGDYILLGLLYAQDKQVVGTYYFAFNLSLQVLALVMVNFSGTMLPVLTQLQDDPPRQVRALLRAARVMALAVTPACIGQAFVADPVVRILFEPKWYPAIPILQALSLAMALQMMMTTAGALMQAQRRLQTFMLWWMWLAAIFLVCVGMGAWLGAGQGAALGVCAYSVLCGPGGLYVAVRHGGGTLGDVARVYLPSLLLSLVACGTAWSLARWTGMGGNPYTFAAAVIAGSALLYAGLARWWCPAEFAELLERLRGLVRRRG